MQFDKHEYLATMNSSQQPPKGAGEALIYPSFQNLKGKMNLNDSGCSKGTDFHFLY